MISFGVWSECLYEENKGSICKQKTEILADYKNIITNLQKKISKQDQDYQKIVKDALDAQKQYGGMGGESSEINENYHNFKNSPETDIIIFVSFSIPDEMLWQYYQQAKKVGGKLVIRGLVNNSFKQTIEHMKIAYKKNLQLEINPKLFNKYLVEAVPAIVIRDHEKFDKFTGTISVHNALEQSAAHGEACMAAKKFLQRIIQSDGKK